MFDCVFVLLAAVARFSLVVCSHFGFQFHYLPRVENKRRVQIYNFIFNSFGNVRQI